MKKLILITLLIFSSPSYADWTRVSVTGTDGATFYVQFERIRIVDGYTYFWSMMNQKNPIKHHSLPGGYALSVKMYHQSDCKLFKIKTLSYVAHTEQMGLGPSADDNVPDADWIYPPPATVNDNLLQLVCRWVELSTEGKVELLQRLRLLLS